jgi:hypothetical protein
MAESRGGAIVMIASVAGMRLRTFPQRSPE